MTALRSDQPHHTWQIGLQGRVMYTPLPVVLARELVVPMSIEVECCRSGQPSTVEPPDLYVACIPIEVRYPARE
jgi:hypothetical protein